MKHVVAGALCIVVLTSATPAIAATPACSLPAVQAAVTTKTADAETLDCAVRLLRAAVADARSDTSLWDYVNAAVCPILIAIRLLSLVGVIDIGPDGDMVVTGVGLLWDCPPYV
jgi:hypothetical protein